MPPFAQARITELAALIAGTYVCGAAAHWRMMERASGRDVFLRYHESASSRLYLTECAQVTPAGRTKAPGSPPWVERATRST